VEIFEDIFLRTIGALQTEQLIIGPVVKQFGPFRLHRKTYSLKGGRLLNSSRYFVVVGELAVPLPLNLGTGSDDPSGYAGIVNDKQGPFRGCAYVGDIAIGASLDRDIYNHVDYWLKYKQTGIECYAEQLATASDASTGNPRREKAYRRYITTMETELQFVSAAFREFMLEYPDAATGTKRTAATNERAARRARKQFSKAIWLINRALR
jgi:hypothetical protein